MRKHNLAELNNLLKAYSDKYMLGFACADFAFNLDNYALYDTCKQLC